VIGPDNKVAVRVVKVERIVGRTVFLASGVTAGERVVTDGQIRLSPGATVTIDEPRRPTDKTQGKMPNEAPRAAGRG
jgi:multidrug efflux system membrane fusion protein